MVYLLSATERVRFSQRFGALQRVGELWRLRSEDFRDFELELALANQLVQMAVHRVPSGMMKPSAEFTPHRSHVNIFPSSSKLMMKLDPPRRSIPLPVTSVGRTGTQFLHHAPVQRAWP